jgi:hypothetical protein
MRLFVACLLLVATAMPVAACINDIESPSHEREFRSRYGSGSAPSAPSSYPPTIPFLLSAGAGLLMTGAIIAVGRLRPR